MSVVHIDYVKHPVSEKQKCSATNVSNTVLSPPLCIKNDSIDRTSECTKPVTFIPNVLNVKGEKDSFVDHIYSVSSAPCKKRKGSNLTPTGTPEKVACKVKKEGKLVAFKTFTFPSATRSVKTQDSRISTSLLVTDLVSQTPKHVTPTAININANDFSLKSKSKKRVVSRLNASDKSVTTKPSSNLLKSNEVISTNNIFSTNSKSCETVSELSIEDAANDNGTSPHPESEKTPVSQLNDLVEDDCPQTLDNSVSLEISSDSNSTDVTFFCSGCGKSFNRKDSRRRHVLKYHPSNTALIESLKPPKLFNCEFCFRRFNNPNYFKQHLRMQHLGMETKYTCPICKEKHDIKRILAHFEDSHEIKLETEVLYADSYEDFLLWKKDMEVRTRTQFNHRSKGYNKAKEYKVHNFCCHRSGNFVPRDKGSPNRDIKRRGTKKINSYCPASLKVIQHKNDKCVIYFHTTHVGHTNDLEDIKLTKKKKKLLAKKKSLRFQKSQIAKSQGPQKITAVDNDGTKTVINPPINSNYYLNEEALNTSTLNPIEGIEDEFKPPKQRSGVKLTYACPICKERFGIKKILGHFEDEHEIELEKEVLEAECYEDFLVWKKDIENTTRSHFNKKSTCGNKNKDFVVHYFYCHRSGHFTPKRRDSKKINSYCPASLKVMEYKDGKCVVHFQTTHVGHTNDLEHLELTKKRKQLGKKTVSFLSEHGELQQVSFVANVCSGTSLNQSVDSVNASMNPTDCVEVASSKDSDPGNVSAANNGDENYTRLLCHACGKSYNRKNNLRRHIRKHHPTETSLIEALRAPKMYSLNDDCMVCLACGKSFNRRNNFKRHILKFHPNETALIEPLQSQNIYNCEHCSETFYNKRKYRCHVRIEHLGIEYKYTCPICREKFDIPLMLPHFEEAHDIKLETDLLEAEAYEDFLMWKEDMERLTRSHFVKKSKGTSKREEYIIHYFYCHRSGNFIHRGRGNRSLKAHGSKKINSYCPASLKVVLYNDGRCFIKFQKTHVGHTNDVEHLRLTKSERELLARKIAANIPFGVILREIRNSYSGNALSRLHLLRRQDLENVKKNLHHYLEPEPDSVYILPTNVEYAEVDIAEESTAVANLSSDTFVSSVIPSVNSDNVVLNEITEVPQSDQTNDTTTTPELDQPNNSPLALHSDHPIETIVSLQPNESNVTTVVLEPDVADFNPESAEAHSSQESSTIYVVCTQTSDDCNDLNDTTTSNAASFVCTSCSKSFNRKDSLKRHALRYHPSNTALIESLKAPKLYSCEHCFRRFNNYKNFNYHQRKDHLGIERKYTCPLCKERFDIRNILKHFGNTHNIELETEGLEVDSFEDFLSWKEDMETTTRSHYNKKGKECNKTNNYVIHYFYCHRSGHFIPRGAGHRNLKSQGSTKIDSYCPASVKCIQYGNGKCIIKFQKTHVGHTNDLEHLRLTKSDRQLLAGKISENIPFDEILSEIRNSGSAQSRLHLVRRHDLENIKKNMDAQEAQLQPQQGENEEESDNTGSVNAERVSCTSCNKSFKRKENLKRHIVKYHSSDTPLMESLKTTKLHCCEHCSENFTSIIKFRKHQRQEHSNLECKFVCPLCGERFRFQGILDHFGDIHCITLENEHYEFESYDEFLIWKEDMETRTLCCYPKRSIGRNKTKDFFIHYFYCHRSGHYNPRGVTDRKLKRQGSKKINSYCPASLKVLQYTDGRCSVKFQTTHVGHTNEIEHIVLSRSEKELLAMKIASNIPFDMILREIRESIAGSELSRLHLLRRKDLENIKKAYNL